MILGATSDFVRGQKFKWEHAYITWMEANIVANTRLMTFKTFKIEKAIQISNRINKIQHEHMFWFLI